MYLLTPQLWPALALFLLLALPMVVTDARESRLPLPLNLGLLGAGAVALPITAVWVGFDHLVSAAVSVLAVWVVLRVLRNRRRRRDPDFRPRTADEAAAKIDALLTSHDPRK